MTAMGPKMTSMGPRKASDGHKNTPLWVENKEDNHYGLSIYHRPAKFHIVEQDNNNINHNKSKPKFTK